MTRNYACQPFCTAQEVFDASCGCELDATDDLDLVEELIDQASDMLSLATGGIISGQCTVTVRPVALCEGLPRWSSYFNPFSYETQYGHWDWRRRFGGLDTIPLRGPHVDIVQVMIDGVVINPSEYGLADDKYLFRRNAKWPTVNDLTLDETQDNTFAITYRFGRPVDRLTRMAAIELTCELAKNAFGKSSSLPRGVVGASIQGASVTIRDRAQALRDGDEQIPMVARFLSVYANDGYNQVSAVWAPELEQRWNLVEVEGPSGS